MDLKQIIAVTLRKNPGKSPEELASIIDERVKFIAEIGGLNFPAAPGNHVSMETSREPVEVRPAPHRDSEIIILPGQDHNPPKDQFDFTPPARLAPPAPERELYTLDELHRQLDQLLPKTIQVSLRNISKPFNVMRVLFKAPKPEMQYVKVTYCIPGQTEGPAVLVHTTEPVSVQDILAEIQKQCEMLYTPTPRRVVAVAPPLPPSMADMESILQHSAGASVGPDENAGPEGYQAQQWPDNVPYTAKT